MKKSTVKTIRFALQFLLDVNRSVAARTYSKVRLERAIRDIDADVDALEDFNKHLESVEVF